MCLEYWTATINNHREALKNRKTAVVFKMHFISGPPGKGRVTTGGLFLKLVDRKSTSALSDGLAGTQS